MIAEITGSERYVICRVCEVSCPSGGQEIVAYWLAIVGKDIPVWRMEIDKARIFYDLGTAESYEMTVSKGIIGQGVVIIPVGNLPSNSRVIQSESGREVSQSWQG